MSGKVVCTSDIYFDNFGHHRLKCGLTRRKAEIEFLLERDSKVIPVEVKAQKGTSKSLNELLKNEEFRVGYKLTAQNAGVVNKKVTLPWYMGVFL